MDRQQDYRGRILERPYHSEWQRPPEPRLGAAGYLNRHPKWRLRTPQPDGRLGTAGRRPKTQIWGLLGFAINRTFSNFLLFGLIFITDRWRRARSGHAFRSVVGATGKG